MFSSQIHYEIVLYRNFLAETLLIAALHMYMRSLGSLAQPELEQAAWRSQNLGRLLGAARLRPLEK